MKKIIAALVVLISLAVSAQADPVANKKLVLDMANMLFVQHKVDQAIDTYFAPGYIQHNPMAVNGAEAIRTLFKGFYAANPAATIVVKRSLADGDLVAIHYSMKIKPDERGFAVIDIFRVENGKIAEHWDVSQPVPEKSANNNGMF